MSPKEYAIDYNHETKILLVDYTLPAPEHIPTLKEVKYVQAKDELAEQHLSQPQLLKLYDDILYNTILRTVHELFEIFGGHNTVYVLTLRSVATNIRPWHASHA